MPPAPRAKRTSAPKATKTSTHGSRLVAERRRDGGSVKNGMRGEGGAVVLYRAAGGHRSFKVRHLFPLRESERPATVAFFATTAEDSSVVRKECGRKVLLD